jgi:type I restriction enzyme S subunit
MSVVQLGKLMATQTPGLNPAQFKDEKFELWSIPAFDAGSPELLIGSEIGSAKKVIQPGDVLLSRIVPHIRRSWVVSESKDGLRQIGSGEWIIFRSKRFDPNYLRHFLISDVFHPQFMQTVAGVGGSLLRARPEGVKEISFYLPPLDEQKRIAGILDQADALRRKRANALARLNSLGQAIFYEMFGAKLKIKAPDTTIADVTDRVTKGESPKWQGHSYVAEGALFVTSENVGWGVMLEKEPKFIPHAFHEGKLARSKLRTGDILINLVGASIGRACLFKSSHLAANINQAVAVVTLSKKHPIGDYLLTYILSPIGQEQILGSRVEGARANISLKDVREFKFHMPSASELVRFSEAKREAGILIERAAAALTHSNSLFSSLQHRVFQGAL